MANMIETKKGMGFRLMVFFIIIIFTLFLFSNIALALKIDKEVNEKFKANDEVDVIIKLKDDKNFNDLNAFEKKEKIKNSQNSIISQFSEGELKIKHQYSAANSFSGRIKQSAFNKLKNNPDVEAIEYDHPVQIALSASAPQINATKLWGLTYNGTNLTGLGQTVCILDTGIQYSHPALGNCTNTTFLGGNCTKVLGGYDYVNTDWDPDDDNGHGTHVAGIVASMNDTYKGIANNASLIAIKVLNSAGSGTQADIIAGIDWCVNNASRYNITVISMSLGTSALYTSYCDDSYTSMTSSINSAIAANISVFAATGNDGNTTAIASPACIQNTTSVSAVNSNDAVSYNRNNITDLLAPGISITASYITSTYSSKSGTSMATPHAAAAAALLREYKRLETGASLTPLQIENALKIGKNITNATGDSITNITRIDLWPALASLDASAPIITFVGPTLPNNTITKNSSFYVNITTNEILASALLEFNNTNTTMNGTGTNFFFNKTLSNGTFSYRVIGIDSFSSTGYSSSTSIQRNNSAAPSISSFSPASNYSMLENSALQFNISVSDADNDLLTFSWKLDSVENATSQNFTFYANFTSSGNHNLTVYVTDGDATSYQYWNLTINNTNRVPSASNVNITPQNATKASNITCSYNYSDPDGDAESSTRIRWFLNNTVNITFENMTSINTSYILKNQTWHCEVTPRDGADYGTAANSSNVTVQNSQPTLAHIAQNTTAENLTFVIQINVTDADNDTLIYGTNFSYGSLNISNGTFEWTPNFTQAGNYSVFFNVTDGVVTASETITVTVNNTNRAPQIDSFAPNAAAFSINENETVSFNHTSSDPDGDNVTYSWRLDGTIQATLQNWNYTSNFSSAAIYNVTLVVSDGSLDRSNYWNLTVNNSDRAPLLNVTIPNQTWYKNANATINLSIYFVEPDGESMNFTNVTAPVNVTISINGSIVTLIPAENWTGNTSVVFNASNNLSALSNTIILNITTDLDGDGVVSTDFSGTDCNDNNAAVYPGASCSRSCYSGSTYDTSCSCSGGSYTCSSSGGGGSGGSSGGGGGGGGGSATASTAQTFIFSLTAGETKTMSLPIEKIAFASVQLAVSANVENANIKFENLKEVPPIGIDVPSETTYQYVQVTKSNIQDSAISSARIQFAVEKSWLSGKDIKESDVVLARYSDHSDRWNELATKKTATESSKYVYYETVSPGFSYFAITAKKAEEKVTGLTVANITNISDINETAISMPFNAISNISNITQTEEKQKQAYLIPLLIAILIVVAAFDAFLIAQKKARKS